GIGVVAQEHGRRRVPAGVRRQQGWQVEIGYHLGVHHQRWSRPEARPRRRDPAAGPQEVGLHGIVDSQPQRAAVAERGPHQIAAVKHVDHRAARTGARRGAQPVGDGRVAADGDQRLRQGQPQRPEAGRPPRGQKHDAGVHHAGTARRSLGVMADSWYAIDMKICVIGTGYVGLVAGAGFADMGNDVTCCDLDAQKIEGLKRGVMPIYEPGLDKLVTHNAAEGRLIFTTDVKGGVAGAEVVLLAVGTPPGPDGSADLSYILKAAGDVADALTGWAVVVTKSTVPVGTGDKIEAIIGKKTKHEFAVASNPEFLKEGDA